MDTDLNYSRPISLKCSFTSSLRSRYAKHRLIIGYSSRSWISIIDQCKRSCGRCLLRCACNYVGHLYSKAFADVFEWRQISFSQKRTRLVEEFHKEAAARRQEFRGTWDKNWLNRYLDDRRRQTRNLEEICSCEGDMETRTVVACLAVFLAVSANLVFASRPVEEDSNSVRQEDVRSLESEIRWLKEKTAEVGRPNRPI